MMDDLRETLRALVDASCRSVHNSCGLAAIAISVAMLATVMDRLADIAEKGEK